MTAARAVRVGSGSASMVESLQFEVKESSRR
jgi:hypothetical protein